ncbi:DUF3298 and DUF4163 domain-containing protein [Pedobacter insulae]|uniref:DUF3298 domain-containing protein n=1 Tax=Pedobacter insulae TaxID=414048 RepID=A0A1I3AA25_9SPHI|nr:DUF3298 and DUF4163 domain-containing protein [Pedobacter insulae]SFH46888.1 Protein of unknown function [Pedobacter insulae]
MKNIIACLLLILTISACRNGKDTKEDDARNTTTVDTLTYAYDSIKVQSKNIPKNNVSPIDTPEAIVSYPVFKNDALNQFIKRQVFNYFAQDEPATSYQAIADSFMKGYDEFVRTNPTTPQAWFLNINIEVLRQSPTYLALKYTHTDYAGGAHGNTTISFLNYNPKTNTPITLDSLIQAGKLPALVKIGEAIFRKNEQLSPTQSLEERYFFDKGIFALAQNFHVSDKGLVFLYNPYEIKAYAEGYTELVIPFEALKDLAKPHTILTTKN